MREVKYPAIYKHFKDKIYATMDISKAIDNKEIVKIAQHTDTKTECYIVVHTERRDPLLLYKIDNNWYHCKNEEAEDLVLYRSLYDNSGIYARPVPMFLSEVDKVAHPDAKQKYRFELISSF